MVHHAMKRFMIILPAIFFKLGIAFTLLVLVAIVAVNNGFIGFMLLVVGLSSVLARFQDSSKKHVVPYYLPAVHHHAGYHGWDRSDKDEEKVEKATSYPAYNPQYVYTPLSAYNSAYYGQKRV